MGGVMTVAVYFGLLALGLLILEERVPYLFLVAVSHLLAVAAVYPWYRLVVFRVSTGSWIAGLARFYLVGLSFLATSVTVLPLLVELAGVHVLLAQSMVIPVSTVLAYLINRSWAFRDPAGVKRW
ncbi:GtrA family protein [Planomonospora parontospora]|nr:GtrA family protein [Planomonospora parontospora]